MPSLIVPTGTEVLLIRLARQNQKPVKAKKKHRLFVFYSGGVGSPIRCLRILKNKYGEQQNFEHPVTSMVVTVVKKNEKEFFIETENSTYEMSIV